MKFVINVSERIQCNHEVTVETNGITEKQFDGMLDIAEKEKTLNDVLDSLKRQGCKIVQTIEDANPDIDLCIDDMFEID